jgi:hypothetical protein
VERAFEEACLRELEAAAGSTEATSHPAEQAVALYERITRLGLEKTTVQMLRWVILAAIVILAVNLLVSPLSFSLNLLLTCIGLLTARARRRDAKADPEERDEDP